MLTKSEQEAVEEQTLASYAMKSRLTRGRDYPIVPDTIRTDFQRDRDRIIHSAAFRKLEYKTQVYFIQEGDYYRTRLTHTLEVAQIGRSLARNLRLNVDLTEAIALAHDLGHTPFGHSGETALRRLMAQHGGFEHNTQGLRVVEKLEIRYPEFPGLNLTWEVREGLIKHSTSYDHPEASRFDPDLMPTLEAQVIEVADEIAFNSHDIDDALAMGLIEEEDLREVGWLWQIWERARATVGRETRGSDRVKYRALGHLIELQMLDALEATEANIGRLGIRSVEDVHASRERLVAFGPRVTADNSTLRDFLMRRVYCHPRVVRMVTKAEGFVERLFDLYCRVPNQLPLECQAMIESEGRERVIADYISGMTDRFLLQDYIRAFEPEPFLRR
jgi:dGTPase